MANTKYIFVTGGVLSGVGKGITAASIGAVLKAAGKKVSIQKCDPYLNVDAGLLNPAEHGECFVTRDGAETDLDLGHYERFLDIELTQQNTTLSGRLLQQLIADERAGKFGGKTVQLVPHLTASIRQAIELAGKDSDVHIVEIGGTVGDYEGLSFVEAIREFGQKVGRENCLYVHVVYVPYLHASQEFKTKPAQNSLADLRGFGIMPDVVGVRTEGEAHAPISVGDKIGMFSGVPREGIIMMPNVDTVYRVPLTVARDLGEKLGRFANFDHEAVNLDNWKRLAKRDKTDYARDVTVGIVAKYIDNSDTYISVIEALKSAAWDQKVDVEIKMIDAERFTPSDLEVVDGILVPGGFGSRGVEGKVDAAMYALEHDKPYFGICLGMQAAVIAAARRGGLARANSTELDPDTEQDVIYIMDGQAGKESTGGTLRLGNYPAKLNSGSRIAEIYGALDVTERHRHRYEVNQEWLDDIEKGGLAVSGTSPDGRLVEFIEAPKHRFFVATQAHPEFRSRPMRPHPLFSGFIEALRRIDK